MPFKRQALGTHAVVGGRAVAVGQELAEMTATNGAFHLVTYIEWAHQKAEQITQLDEPLAGKYLGKKGDEFLHHS